MAGHSLDNLLAWMRNPQNNVMWGWDAIVAMDRDKSNRLLLQEYIARFTNASYLPPISGEVEMAVGAKEYIHDFQLGVPRLSFENVDIEHSRARLTCSIMGGVQLSMKNNVDFWTAVKVSEIDPLQGPKLALDLHLDSVPGNVDRDGRVMFDLKDSDDFILTFAETSHEQRLGGEFFKDLFNSLPPEQRVLVLGRLEGREKDVLRPQSFRLHTQANPQASGDVTAASHGDGAVLIFICMVGGHEGGGISPDYPYLIPDDAGKSFSATVLFDRNRGSAGILLDRVSNMINSHDFAYSYDGNGKLLSAVARSGRMVAPAAVLPLPPASLLPGYDQPGLARLSEVVFLADSEHPLTVTFNDEELQVTWRTQATGTAIMDYPDLATIELEFSCSIALRVKYQLVEVTEGIVSAYLVQTDYELTSEFDIPEQRSLREPDPFKPIRDLLIALLLNLLQMTWVFAVLKIEVTAHIELTFAINIVVGPTVSKFLKDHVKLSFNQAIQGDIVRAPRDLGFFGRVNPTRTSFLINPVQPIMAAGSQQQFATDPLGITVVWAVEDVLRSARSPGSISASGLYTAPAAEQIDGRFIRVRVIATERNTGYFSSALVTVMVNELTINPLIQLCDHDQSVELAAGALGGAEVSWAIRNPVAGESGTLKPSELIDGDHRYRAGPKVANKTYVLDEIEVTHGNGKKRSAWVLVLQKQPLLVVKPLTDNGLPWQPESIRLQALFDDSPEEAEWTLPLGGPGSIDSDGIYRTDPAATERFVLIFAAVLLSPTRKIEGHIILPLPLNMFPDEL